MYFIVTAVVFGTITVVTGQSGYPSARLPTSNSQNPTQYDTQQKQSPGYGPQGQSQSGFGVPGIQSSGFGSQSMQPPTFGGQSMSSSGSYPDLSALAMMAARGRGGGGASSSSSSTGLGGMFGSLFGGGAGMGMSPFLLNSDFMQDFMRCRMMFQMSNMKANPQHCMVMISQGLI